MKRIEQAFNCYDDTLRFAKLIRQETILRLVTAGNPPSREEIGDWIMALICTIGDTDYPESIDSPDECQKDIL